MRNRVVGLLAVLASVFLLAESASAAGSSAFCNTWLKVCNRTCPGGPGTCSSTCQGRYTACLSSGCFFFNTPGPRCQSSATDQSATTKAKKTMREGGQIGCGPRFGGRPCN